MNGDSNFNLQRFINAQNALPFEDALREIVEGRKRGHWIWYIFPQISGLGHPEQSRYYAIECLSEARAFAEHAVLGRRLVEITEALIAHRPTPPESILGEIDAMKVRSCMTLFQMASEEDVFGRAIDSLFDGKVCPVTSKMLAD
jgi:uncharacterized protein (DUF1810 family)